jgi:hypothetical protein
LDAFTSSGNYLGTNRIGRPLTDAESRRLDKLLIASGFRVVSVHAFRFALRLAKTKGRAEDVVSRANLRLVCTGWDPNVVSLQRRMLRLVWSEFTHDRREEVLGRRLEEEFLREQGIHGPVPPPAAARGDPLRPPPKEPAASSVEQEAIALEEEQAELADRRKKLDELIARLRANEDQVALEYLEFRRQGTVSPAEMVEACGRKVDVKVFYEAARRVQRLVERIAGEKPGAPRDDDENEGGP